jgi:hypothetical protein
MSEGLLRGFITKAGFETVSFDEFTDRLEKELATKYDIPLEVLRIKFSSGHSRSQGQLDRDWEKIQRQRKTWEDACRRYRDTKKER